jgi:hypothetical protein
VPTNFSNMDNKHLEAISVGIIMQVKARLNEIRALLNSCAITFSHEVSKMSEKSLAFVEKLYSFVFENPSLVPSYLKPMNKLKTVSAEQFRLRKWLTKRMKSTTSMCTNTNTNTSQHPMETVHKIAKLLKADLKEYLFQLKRQSNEIYV